MRTAPAGRKCDWADVELIRGWRTTMLSIARMEMEHLAITNNLLSALGEAPEFHRTAFPVDAAMSFTGLPHNLNRFDPRTLGWFILYEMPDNVTDYELDFLAWLRASDLAEDEWLADELSQARRIEKRSIVALYGEIESLLKRLASPDTPDLWVGPQDAQIGNAAVFPSFPPTPNGIRRYDVLIATVQDVTTALAAMKQIRHEGVGEVRPDLPEGGHFQQLVEMYKALSLRTRKRQGFEPSRPVVRNPRPAPLAPTDDPNEVTAVSNGATVAAMEVYDLGYSTCLRLLTRLFTAAHPAETPVLQDTVFFPMMTLLLRPLGDLLTHMPVSEKVDGRMAGPSFRPPSDLALQPHSVAAMQVLLGELEELRDRSSELAGHPDLPPDLQPRFTFLSENMWRLAYNFSDKAGFGIPK